MLKLSHKRLVSTGLLALAGVSLLLGGCAGEDVVYKRSIAELNTRAMQRMNSGDVAGAICRLESALDLGPNEPATLNNLAIAYQTAGHLDQAIPLLEKLLTVNGVDKPQILRSLGIAYEQKGDDVLNKAKDADAKGPKLSPMEAVGYYQKAHQFYEQALAGYANPQELKNQMQLLQTRIAEIEAGRI
jgi:tetratricopeptide (TPR) repeat protein